MKKLLKEKIISIPFIRKLALRLTRDVPRVIMYHRFNEPTSLGFSQNVTRDVFEWQLGIIRKDFNVITLSELIRRARRKEPVENAVVITIDDAYKDFYDVAYPLLRQNKLCATLFVSSDFALSGGWFWWDALKYILLNSKQRGSSEFTFNGNEFRISLSSAEETLRAWHLLSDYLLGVAEDKREEFLGLLSKLMRIKLPPMSVEPFTKMNRDDLQEVLKNRIEIGAHGATHRVLSRVGRAELRTEVEGSKAALEEITGHRVETFSYPHGMPDDYNAQVIDSVKAAGYEGAVVAYEKTGGMDGFFTIGRIPVSNDPFDFLWKIYGFDSIIKRLLFK